MTPSEAVAREAIRATQAAYHLAGDRGRIDELAETFTPAGVLELSAGVHEGRDAIRAALSGVRSGSGVRPAFLHHHLTTSHIELVGEGAANGWSYFLVMSPVGIDHSGRYVDQYVDVGEQWLIARRRVVIAWASPESVVGAKVPAWGE